MEILTINSLPDEILLKIFSYARDKQVLRKICSRWRNICGPVNEVFALQYTSTYYLIKFIKQLFHPWASIYYFDNIVTFEEIINYHRDISSLIVLILMDSDDIIRESLKVIDQCCTNLEELAFFNCGEKWGMNKLIPTLMPKLKTLTIDGIYPSNSENDDYGLDNFFMNTNNLEQFYLLDFPTSKCMIKTLPKNLKHLHVGHFVNADGTKMEQLTYIGHYISQVNEYRTAQTFPFHSHLSIDIDNDLFGERMELNDLDRMTSIALHCIDINHRKYKNLKLFLSKLINLKYLHIRVCDQVTPLFSVSKFLNDCKATFERVKFFHLEGIALRFDENLANALIGMKNLEYLSLADMEINNNSVVSLIRVINESENLNVFIMTGKDTNECDAIIKTHRNRNIRFINLNFRAMVHTQVDFLKLQLEKNNYF